MTRTDICNSSDLVIVHVRDDGLLVYIIIIFIILTCVQFSLFRRIRQLEESQLIQIIYNHTRFNETGSDTESDSESDSELDPTNHT